MGVTWVLIVDTNERPFQCPQCPSTFGRLDTLIRHERTLHGFSNSAASNHPAQRYDPTHSSTKSVSRSGSTTSSRSPPVTQHLDRQLARFRESPTITQPDVNPLSPTHHNPQSPSRILNGTKFSPPSNLLSNPSSSLVNATAVHPTPHKPHFSPLAESPVLWDSFLTFEAIPPSASFGDIQFQLSRLHSSLLPTVPPSSSSLTQTQGPLAATPNLDSFIHSPSPMSFPLSSERGLVIPTHVGSMSSPTNSGATYPTGSNASFSRKLENFDPGILDSYLAECDVTISLADFDLPKKDVLNQYLFAYFEGMHQHHPFIHTATFDSVSFKGIFLSDLLLTRQLRCSYPCALLEHCIILKEIRVGSYMLPQGN